MSPRYKKVGRESKRGTGTRLEDRILTLEAALAETRDTIQTLRGQLDQLHQTVQVTTHTSGETQAKKDESMPSLDPVIRLEHKPLNLLNCPHLIFEGVSVHIQSGSGASHDRKVLTGLGYLIIRYNEQPTGLEPHDPNGAHNVIVGGQHKFRSTDGLVEGFNNTLASPLSTICGGYENKTNGPFETNGWRRQRRGQQTFLACQRPPRQHRQ